MQASRSVFSIARSLMRLAAVAGALILLWQAIVTLAGQPAFILPAPARVLQTLFARADFLMFHAAVTAGEIVLGLGLGTVLGVACGVVASAVAWLRPFLSPILVASQAIPVFAIAPLLVLWFGYGIGSKIAMATLIIFFPIAAATQDGLSRTPVAWLQTARSLGLGPLQLLWRVRLPAALPAIGSGLKIAAAVAPIGAIIGEWVGASAGLGFVMIQANARMQTDLMFAALLVLATLAVTLHRLVAAGVDRALYWQPDTTT